MIIKGNEGKIEGEKIKVYRKENNDVMAESASEEVVVSVDNTVPTRKDNGDYPIVFEEKDGHVEVFVNNIDDNIVTEDDSTSYGTLEVQNGKKVEIGLTTSLVVNF